MHAYMNQKWLNWCLGKLAPCPQTIKNKQVAKIIVLRIYFANDNFEMMPNVTSILTIVVAKNLTIYCFCM